MSIIIIITSSIKVYAGKNKGGSREDYGLKVTLFSLSNYWIKRTRRRRVKTAKRHYYFII